MEKLAGGEVGYLAATLATIPDGPSKDAGIAAGQGEAAQVLAERQDDGLDTASVDVPWSPPSTDPGVWQPTPPAFGPAVRVNTLMPGPSLTDISKAWNLDDDPEPFPQHALKRAGEPAEIIGAALFLMSNASSFTTGSILRSDGGIP